MEITLNGEKREIPEGMTVSELLALVKTQAERVVVELNLAILKRDQHGATQLKAGDQVEIVRFVGGGSENRSRLKAVSSRQLPPASSLQPTARR